MFMSSGMSVILFDVLLLSSTILFVQHNNSTTVTTNGQRSECLYQGLIGRPLNSFCYCYIILYVN